MTNELGKQFLQEARGIIEECARLKTPERAARVAVFSMLVMLDGSGEHCDFPTCHVITEDGEQVEFFHHDLG